MTATTPQKRKPIAIPATRADLEDMKDAILSEMDRKLGAMEQGLRTELSAIEARLLAAIRGR